MYFKLWVAQRKYCWAASQNSLLGTRPVLFLLSLLLLFSCLCIVLLNEFYFTLFITFSYSNWMPVMPFFWNIMLFLPFLHIFGAGSRNGLILIFDSRVLRIWCLQLPQRQIHSTSLNTCWHQNRKFCSKRSKMRNIFKIVKEGFVNISPNNFVHYSVKTKTLSEISQVVFQEKVSSKVIPGKAFLKIKWCIEWSSLK